MRLPPSCFVSLRNDHWRRAAGNVAVLMNGLREGQRDREQCAGLLRARSNNVRP